MKETRAEVKQRAGKSVWMFRFHFMFLTTAVFTNAAEFSLRGSEFELLYLLSR